MRRIPTEYQVKPDDTDDLNERELIKDADAPDARGSDLITAAMPGLDTPIELKHHAGRITLEKGKNNNIFYWHIVASKTPETAPLVIWLNGGPGCSSMQGALTGISPFWIQNPTTLKINPHSWHHHSNLLFIDQPIGTGMSYTKGNEYRNDEKMVAKDFYQFLVQFLRRHSEYLTVEGQSRALYMFGESHAGRWLPTFSDYIITQNKNQKKNTNDFINIQLQGIGIGNGWVHPLIQYDYSDFAHGLGLLTFGQVRSLKTEYIECENALLSGTFRDPSCFKNMNTIIDGLKDGPSPQTLNYYDVRQYVNDVGKYPIARQYMTEYLNQMIVRQVLHGNMDPTFRFRDCSDPVYDGLRSFDGVSTLSKVERTLASGIRVLFFNGQWDMMCHHYGTEKLLLHLQWNGSIDYQAAKKYTWSVHGRTEPAGFAQQGGNLTYIVIPGAGHMVPMDVPDVASEMVKRFTLGIPFTDSAQQVKSMMTNSSNLDAPLCPVNVSLDKTSSGSLAWLWATIGVILGASLLIVCITLLCNRGKKEKRGRHSIIIQMDDDEDESDRNTLATNDDDVEADEPEITIRSRG